jgi:hypothetical protein
MSGLLMERLQFISGKDPVADAFAGTAASDVVDMSEFSRIVFLAHIGVGATGTSTVTVEACDDIVPTNTTAIPFHYRIDHVGDEGAIAAAAAAGFATTAGSAKIVAVEVREDALASTNYRYVRAVYTEVVDSPVLGGVLIVGERKRQSAAALSAID